MTRGVGSRVGEMMKLVADGLAPVSWAKMLIAAGTGRIFVNSHETEAVTIKAPATIINLIFHVMFSSQ